MYIDELGDFDCVVETRLMHCYGETDYRNWAIVKTNPFNAMVEFYERVNRRATNTWFLPYGWVVLPKWRSNRMGELNLAGLAAYCPKSLLVWRRNAGH